MADPPKAREVVIPPDEAERRRNGVYRVQPGELVAYRNSLLGNCRPSEPATIAPAPQPIPRDVVKEIAMDIGKEVAAHIEVQYPEAAAAGGPSMLLSVRNCTYNDIMAALEATDEAEIRARLARRKKHRREMRAAWRRIRRQDDAHPAWKDLATDPPTGEKWVLLHHPAMHSDPLFPGLSVVASNAEYARESALAFGYTRWAPIPYPLPGAGP